MKNSTILEARGVSKAFPGVRALDSVNIEIEKGEIHSIVGENGAGKSTLMNIFSGVYPADAGEILLDGEPVIFKNVFGAIKQGISIIFQEFNLMPDLTVAENILISDIPIRGITIDKKGMEKRVNELIASVGIELDPATYAKDLSVSQCQLVEVLRAISNQSKILIMDEPTAALNNEESEILFNIIKQLNSQGTTIIYISHKMKEVFEISDRITILRDGKFITTVKTEETDQEAVVMMMVGRNLATLDIKKEQSHQEVIYSVRDASLPGVFQNINFDVHRGEILSITGLMGCGNIELTKKLFGLIKEGECKQYLFGEGVNITSPKVAMEKGLAFVTEDRKNSGILARMSAKENASISILKKIQKRNRFLNLKQEAELFNSFVDHFEIKCTADQEVNNLSGGNQQKILVSRALMTNGKVLILLEPTRGIDVGAKAQMYKLIKEFAEEGMAIIMVSSDLPEVIQLSDRVMIMYNGEQQGFLEGENITEDQVIMRATGLWREKNE